MKIDGAPQAYQVQENERVCKVCEAKLPNAFIICSDIALDTQIKTVMTEEGAQQVTVGTTPYVCSLQCKERVYQLVREQNSKAPVADIGGVTQ